MWPSKPFKIWPLLSYPCLYPYLYLCVYVSVPLPPSLPLPLSPPPLSLSPSPLYSGLSYVLFHSKLLDPVWVFTLLSLCLESAPHPFSGLWTHSPQPSSNITFSGKSLLISSTPPARTVHSSYRRTRMYFSHISVNSQDIICDSTIPLFSSTRM